MCDRAIGMPPIRRQSIAYASRDPTAVTKFCELALGDREWAYKGTMARGSLRRDAERDVNEW